jgi:hypothetical protein
VGITPVDSGIPLRFAKDGDYRLSVPDLDVYLHAEQSAVSSDGHECASESLPVPVIFRLCPYDRCCRSIMVPAELVKSTFDRSALFALRNLPWSALFSRPTAAEAN